MLLLLYTTLEVCTKYGMVSTFVLWGLWHGLWSCVETALHLPKKLERLRCAAALRGALALLLFLLCLMTLAANSFQPFIYASF